MSSLGRYSSASTALIRSLVPNSSDGRPSRGINPLLICWVVRPGFCASRKPSLMTVPGIRPLPALFGTTPGMVQLPPPVGLQAVGVPKHCAVAGVVLDGDPVPFALLNELRLALVQPI